jgi:stearoyl-CoA desaturase (delta-9 desaturase)
MPNTARYARDIGQDPLLQRIAALYPLWFAAGFVLPTLLGGLWTGTVVGAEDGLLWGGFVRCFVLQHAIWSINSVCHLVGDRPHATREGSRNVWWLALVSFGESWHNNHHAEPAAACHGFRSTQVDLAGLVIRGLARAGWITEVRWPRSPER